MNLKKREKEKLYLKNIQSVRQYEGLNISFSLMLRFCNFTRTLWLLSYCSFSLSSGGGACYIVFQPILPGQSCPAHSQGAGIHENLFFVLLFSEVFCSLVALPTFSEGKM